MEPNKSYHLEAWFTLPEIKVMRLLNWLHLMIEILGGEDEGAILGEEKPDVEKE